MVLFWHKKEVLHIAVGVIVWPLAIPDTCAQESHARSPITASQIIETMQARQLPTSGVQVSLAVPITSTVARPSLEIQAIAPLDSRDMRLRVACRNRSECLPFFAVARYPETINPFQIEHVHVPDAATQTTSATNLIAAAPVSSPSSKTPSDATPVVRSGSAAMLDFDEDRVHVRVEVICLESGAAGDKIRVTTRDHKQIYKAEIVAPKILKGALIR